MNGVIKLKIAAFILFWFGVLLQFFVITEFTLEYYREGTFEGYTLETILSWQVWGYAFLSYTMLIHVVHIIAGLWLAGGKQKGIVLGLIISVYEIFAFFIPNLDPVLYTPIGIGFRILFILVIILIISGKKEITILQKTKWKPWKNPLSSKLDDQKV